MTSDLLVADDNDSRPMSSAEFEAMALVLWERGDEVSADILEALREKRFLTPEKHGAFATIRGHRSFLKERVRRF